MGFSDAAPGACIDGGAGTGTGGLLSHDALIVGMPQRCYGLRLTVAAADTGALLQSWICAGGFLLADCRSQAVAQGRGCRYPDRNGRRGYRCRWCIPLLYSLGASRQLCNHGCEGLGSTERRGYGPCRLSPGYPPSPGASSRLGPGTSLQRRSPGEPDPAGDHRMRHT